MKHKLNIAKNLMLGIIFVVVIISCNTAENGWEKARQKNTIEAYESFLINYNDSSYFKKAIQEIWVITTKNNTIQVYEDFLKKYPESKHANEALSSIWAMTVKKNSIAACENFLIEYPNSSLTSMVTEEINKLFTSLSPPTPTCQLNSSLSVDIAFESVVEADSYIIYWSSSKNGLLNKANSQSTNNVIFTHWPESFPIYYCVVAVRGEFMSKPSASCKAVLLPSKDGTICQICGENSIGYCHLRNIYVCSTHNIYTSKDGTYWQCP
jgi:hypothetical protein